MWFPFLHNGQTYKNAFSGSPCSSLLHEWKKKFCYQLEIEETWMSQLQKDPLVTSSIKIPQCRLSSFSFLSDFRRSSYEACVHVCASLWEKGSESERIAVTMWSVDSLTLTTHLDLLVGVAPSLSSVIARSPRVVLSERLRGRGYWYTVGFWGGRVYGLLLLHNECSYSWWPTSARMGAATASHLEARELARDACMELRNGRIRATKASKKMTPRVLRPPTPPLGRQDRSVSLAAATASPALCGSARGTLLCSSL